MKGTQCASAPSAELHDNGLTVMFPFSHVFNYSNTQQDVYSLSDLFSQPVAHLFLFLQQVCAYPYP